jgi:hypothetical protein
MQLFVSWFTFFAGTTILMQGWILQNWEDVSQTRLIVTVVIVGAISQEVMGVILCWGLKSHFVQVQEHIGRIAAGVNTPHAFEAVMRSHPVKLYLLAIWLAKAALVSFVVVWLFTLGFLWIPSVRP